MQLRFGFQVGLVRSRHTVIAPEVNCFALVSDGRQPFSALTVKANPLRRGKLSPFPDHVAHVLRARRHTQIAKTVIRFQPVDVVYIALRPRAGHVKPGQAMRSNQAATEINVSIPRSLNIPGLGSSTCSAAASFQPDKHTGFRVIVQQTAKMISII